MRGIGFLAWGGEPRLVCVGGKFWACPRASNSRSAQILPGAFLCILRLSRANWGGGCFALRIFCALCAPALSLRSFAHLYGNYAAFTGAAAWIFSLRGLDELLELVSQNFCGAWAKVFERVSRVVCTFCLRVGEQNFFGKFVYLLLAIRRESRLEF